MKLSMIVFFFLIINLSVYSFEVDYRDFSSYEFYLTADLLRERLDNYSCSAYLDAECSDSFLINRWWTRW